MTADTLRSRAATFRELNLAGGLLLPNPWDAISARILEAAGFPAVATTSAGAAFARGFQDSEIIGRDLMLQEVALIARSVHVPVTADIESGYGPGPDDVATTIEGVLDAGAVGINLEDATHGARETPLYAIEEQTARIAAARTVADRREVSLVINARTDSFLRGLEDSDEARLEVTIARGRAYLAAGADIVFIPGLLDPSLIRRAVDGISGPVSLMAAPGAPPAADLFAAGAKRISLGPFAMFVALRGLRDLANELRTSGSFDLLGTGLPYAEVSSLLPRS